MHPILLELPSKLLFFALLALGMGSLLRRRRRWRSTLVLLAGAGIVLAVCGGNWPAIPVYSYATMLWTSLMVGWVLALRFAREDGIPAADAAAIYQWGAVWSIVGARLLYVLTNPGEVHSVLDVVALWRGGLVAYGGMIGGFLASVFLCRRRSVPLLRWGDAAAPSIALGTALTRVGCLLFGCDFGSRTQLPWALRFPSGSPAWIAHRLRLGLPADAAWSYPVHPTQLYELLAGLLIFAVLLYVRKARTFPGAVFAAWVMGYGILRPIIEIFRDDPERGSVGPLSTSQFIGIVSAVAAAVLLVHLSRTGRTRLIPAASGRR